MQLKYDAISYVLKNGYAYHKLYMFKALGESEHYKDVQAKLIDEQNTDGGWPWRWEKKKPSGVGETARGLELLLKTSLDKCFDVARDAVNFLLESQKTDGGWPENSKLEGIIPKDWGWISTKHSMTHRTGDVINALIEAGYLREPRVEKAINFLKSTQNKEGGWLSHVGPDYPYEGTDIAAMDVIVKALILYGEAKDSLIFKKAIDSLLANRKDWKLPVCGASVLDVFIRLGYPLEHEYVTELVNNLIETQRPDGGWNWMEDLPSNPGQTVYCIKQLIKCGLAIE